jgi:metallo-beta-lactamase family protein
MRVTFMGATGTVTGSKFLVESGTDRILVDCGLFQGLKKLRERNWAPLLIDPKEIDAVVLTHAHIDHSGYLPRLVRDGFTGPIFATSATTDLAGLLLPDAAYLQEEEARFRNKHRFTKHSPALPLYTSDDASAALRLFRSVPYRSVTALGKTLSMEMIPAGHILGSAFVRLRQVDGPTILFTGDIGRFDQPIIKDPSPVDATDYLVLESTYGNRLHKQSAGREGKAALRDVILKTVARGGTVLVPSFAIGRAQELLYILRELEEEKAIPVLPVFVDSPMAINAVDIFRRHVEEFDAEMKSVGRRGVEALSTTDTRFTRTQEESRRINDHPGSAIIISASGMATGGRILHHLTQRIIDERNSVVFVGYQAAGTRGRTLVDGADRIRIFGVDLPVRAEVFSIEAFSAHGDHGEILDWLSGFRTPPRKTFLVHGEPPALEGMRDHIIDRFGGWNVVIPEYGEAVDL